MSQENVELVRRLYETTDGRLDAGLEFLAPEIELHLTASFPTSNPCIEATRASSSSSIG